MFVDVCAVIDIAWARRRWNSRAILSQRYFLYPIHVSLSFLMTKGLESAMYLLPVPDF